MGSNSRSKISKGCSRILISVFFLVILVVFVIWAGVMTVSALISTDTLLVSLDVTLTSLSIETSDLALKASELTGLFFVYDQAALEDLWRAQILLEVARGHHQAAKGYRDEVEKLREGLPSLKNFPSRDNLPGIKFPIQIVKIHKMNGKISKINGETKFLTDLADFYRERATKTH